MAPAAAQTSAGAALTWSFAVTASDTGAIETAEFIFTVWNAATVAPGGIIGPITGRARIGLVSVAVAAAAAPFYATLDFIDSTAGTGVVATIGDCVTNLLYPWLVNVVGFDSGITIANTTADDAALGAGAGAIAQNGTCVVTGWPAGVAGAPTVSLTTPPINAGMTFATVLSSANNPAFNGFVGYAIAQCNFLNAHGFAFITDGFGTASPTQAQGYLALIIAGPRVLPLGESLGQ